MTQIKRHQRVALPIIELECGEVINIRFDDRSQAIFTISLDNTTIMAGGIYYSRESELIPFPSWMTKEQTVAVVRVYQRDTKVAASFKSFLSTVVDYGDYAGLPWKGMFLGIEKDGYTHS